MTFQAETPGAGSSVLKVLVVATIVVVAYWASTSGLERIVTPMDTTIPATSTTTT